MTTHGTHFSALAGQRDWGRTFPSEPVDGQEFIDNINNRHCIYDATNSVWWCAGMTTSTSTSTTSTSSSTTSTSSSTSSSTTTSTSSSTSTSTTV